MIPLGRILLVGSTAVATALPGRLDQSSSEMTFVTRPDLRPPQFNVSTHHRDRLSSGYWFVAPYADLGAQSGCPSLCQVGPHIYDDYGQLIWSGACDVKNRNSFDFKVWEQGAARGLSLAIEGQANSLDMWHKRGAGLIMDDSYTILDSVDPQDEVSQFNFHEFTRSQDPRGILMLYDGSSNVNDKLTQRERLVWDGGFTELDSEGNVTFHWRALDHIDLAESTAIKPDAASTGVEWDWFHANSIDKMDDGNYLLSARHTDCIYRISAATGAILWRLGGTRSTLDLQGFNFSRQHDARFATSDLHGSTKDIISFLNNGGDSHRHSSDTSAAYLVEIDADQQTARLIHQWPRPNGKLGTYRGNVQFLENGNVFAHWGDNGHITEFDGQGVVLQEAYFRPTHLGTYRAYKLDFVANPSEPIVIKCTGQSVLQGIAAAMCYVSWNGATEVTYWEMVCPESGDAPYVARAEKTGFETALIVPVRYRSLAAKAFTANGSVLAVSEVYTVNVPALPFNGAKMHHRLYWGLTAYELAWNSCILTLTIFILANVFARLCYRCVHRPSILGYG